MGSEEMGKNVMRKVDLKLDSPNIKQAEMEYMRRIEMQNLQRVEKLKKMKRKSNVIGSLIFGGVLGIYFYTMYAVRQEKFLDFEVPADSQKEDK